MNPITDDMTHCIICGTGENIHKHHLIAGTSNRKKSTEFQLVVPLCAKHHNLGNNSMHLNPDMMILGKIIGQLAFEKQYCAFNYTYEEAREKFRNVFGKSYL